MAEVRNTFIKSKMNKDLDARIVPDGEYRDAVNIAINTSEGADVGALENVLGNIMKTDFGLSTICNLEVIGYHMDNTNNRMFIMLTDYTDTSTNKLNNHSYSTGATSYIALYNLTNDSFSLLVGGSFLNFSTTHPIYATNVLENYLFWTDNRNQPRKINIDTAIANPANGVFPYYTKEEHVSVAKISPCRVIELIKSIGGGVYGSTMKDTTSQYLPPNHESAITPNPDYNSLWVGDGEFLKERMVRFSYRFKFDDGEYSTIAPFTQICFVPQQDGYFTKVGDIKDQDRTFTSTEVQFMRNKITQIALQIPAPYVGLLGTALWSDMYDRLKIVEVDILYKESNGLAVKVVDTITRAQWESTVTGYFEYVYNSQKPFKVLPEKELVRISDVVPIRALGQEISGNRVIYGNFINKHTSPPNLTYTVSTQDKGANAVTPRIADIRKEYQNHTLKQNRTYQVGIVLADVYGRQSTVILSSLDTATNLASTIYHPYKLSTSLPDLITDGALNVGDTWPGDALNINFPAGGIPTEIPSLEGYPGMWSESNPLGWYSYKVVVKQQEQEYYNIYFPGLLNGYTNPPAAATAAVPVGHFVLTGDNINKVPKDLQGIGPAQVVFGSSPLHPTGFGELPADILDPEGYYERSILQGKLDAIQQNTSLTLYGRVINNSGSTNQQHYLETTSVPPLPLKVADTVTNIGTLSNLQLVVSPIIPGTYLEFAWDVGGVSQLNDFAAARVSLIQYNLGVSAQTLGNMLPVLSVYETAPVESRIDIYWETSTCDNAIELNSGINSNDNISIKQLLDYGSYIEPALPSYANATPAQFYLEENAAIGSTAVLEFFGYNNIAGSVLYGTYEIVSVINGLGADITNNFELDTVINGLDPITTRYKVITTNTFISWGDERDYYTITLQATSPTPNFIDTYLRIAGVVLNSPPVITSPVGSPTAAAGTIAGSNLYTLVGNNGSASTTELGQNLYWRITSQVLQGTATEVDFFYLNNQNVNIAKSGTIELHNSPMLSSETGIYDVIVELRDRESTTTEQVATTTFNVTIT